MNNLEIVTFICSACGKRSVSPVANNKMICRNCKEVFGKDDEGTWYPGRYLKMKKAGKI